MEVITRGGRMSENSKTRLSRAAAKYKPHRSEQRFFAARTDARHACEELRSIIRRSVIHDSMKKDLLTAVARAEAMLVALSPTAHHPGATAKEIAKQVDHLRVAETWVAAADRVLTRLHGGGPVTLRHAVEECQDAVMWCVRAERWDGHLTAAVTRLEAVVKEAEVHASRKAG
jgi:leucyl aminopeptidase (aminopeptidase T)